MAKSGKRLLRKVLSICWKLAVFLLICVVGLYIYMDYHSKHYDIKFYQVTSGKLNTNLRIALITDLHLRVYGDNNDPLIEDIEALNPDLILLGGDLVTYPQKEYDTMLDFCGRIAELAPVYAVTGNHEDELMYLSGDKKLIERFEEKGVVFLVNKDATIDIGENHIQLVGVNGGVSGFEKYGAKDEMDSLKDDDSCYRIVMDHVPFAFAEKLSEYSFDLGVAGHVHGGIVRLPKVGGLYSMEEGILPDYTKGTYSLTNGGTLVVSAGLGDSSKLPLRFNNNPELVIIDINWY